MAKMTDMFRELVSIYRKTPIEFENLRAVTVAQWILESGRGDSGLAREYLNFGGMKYRPEMKPYASKVEYKASDGVDEYCKFATLEDFIAGYWAFLDRAPYKGWRDHTDTPDHFIKFIGRIYTPTGGYAEAVLGLVQEASAALAGSNGAAAEHASDGAAAGPIPPGTSEPFPKPPIKKFIQSPHFNSRNGARINRIVLHYTTSPNVDGTISWFQDPRSKVSAHYVIARNGDIYQMVRDADSAWHARSANAESIGIEHSAGLDDQMTPEQEASSIALLRWLVGVYKLRWEDVDGHRFVPGNNTDCPGHLFGEASEAALRTWIERKARP